MIFDERDLEENNEEENKTPQKNQMMFDDLFLEKDKKPSKTKKTESKSSENIVSDKIVKKSSTRLNEYKKKKQVEDLNEYVLDAEVGDFEKENISSNDNFDDNNFENNNFDGGDFNDDDNNIEYDEEGNILKSIKQVMNDAMMPYSEYVILDRALPRVEDGLKPVQRRIIYDMYEQGLTPDKPFRKSATIVGDVIGKYHPHGDTSVYDAMVKLAQDFNMREPLVFGHGNFGSMDGDGAAAYRYTEAKLKELSLELLKDIEKDTVKWSLNYDDKLLEPDTLPSRFPNILVNGNMGIAVGIATKFASHNLGESIDACVAYIDNPNITVDELMDILHGPDFPTGGVIVGLNEVKQAYETGKGKVILRAKIEVEPTKGDKINLVITEFPYGVNKAQCLQKIYELKENNKETLSCITDIRDESGRQGVRGVITLKGGTDPQKIINYLYKYSDLQTTFGINMMAIADGKPKLLTLKDILGYYTRYQKDVVLKRTTYDLNIAKEREHILHGLIIAIENIDEIVKIIKNSASTVEAKQTLKQRYDLSERQAQAIMDMRLSRLTNLEVEKLRAEIAELLKLINKLTKIVNSEKLQYNVVKEEMLEIKKKFNSKRKTEIVKENAEIKEEDIIKVVKPYYVLTTEKQAIKKIPEKTYLKYPKIIDEKSTLNEIHSNIILTSSDKNILIFTNLGNIYKISVDKIIEARFKDRGIFLKDLIVGFNPEEKVVKIFEENEKLYKQTFIFYTKNGLVKLTDGSEFDVTKNISSSIKLKDDEVINLEIFDEKKNVIFITKLGMGLYAKCDDIPKTSKTAQGVKGISLNDDDYVIFASQTVKNDILVTTNKGYSKKLELNNFELLSRSRKGVKVYSLGKGESVGDKLIFANLVDTDYDLFVVDNKNKNYIVDTSNILYSNRVNKGNILVKDRKQMDLVNIYKII